MHSQWENLFALASLLPAWYDKQARVLPWRVQPTPYRVWISEIMLQQTRVEAVIPYYARFLQRLPNVAALAEVPDDELMKLWQGLGYYSRARNLKRAAQVICSQHGGVFPQEYAAIRTLPGVGDYTAGAVASIAFGLPVPAVDGNALRVFARLLADGRDITAPALKKEYTAGIAALLPTHCPGSFNQAVMDIGAGVCIPNGAPKCAVCPLQSCCRAYALGIQHTLPVKAPKKARRQEQLTVFLLRDAQERVLLRRRPEEGLLAGLWEFPHAPGSLTQQQALQQISTWGMQAQKVRPLPAAVHIFTHIRWDMTGMEAVVEGEPPQGWRWCTPAQIEKETPIASAFARYTALAVQA